LLAIAGYCLYITVYGVTAIYWDEWNLVPIVANSISGHLTFAQLWGLHNENRIFFPNLLSIVIARTFSWNDLAFYFVSASLLLGVFVVIVAAFWPNLRRGALWWLPVPFLVFTLAQSENTLWAFQMAWYLELFCVVASLALLSARRVRHLYMAVALATGFIASYSSFAGLLVWPAGLLLLCAPGRSWRQRSAWAGAGILAVILYFLGTSPQGLGARPLSAYAHNVSTTLKAFFVSVGSVIPNVNVGLSGSPAYLFAGLVGLTISTLAVVVVLTWLRDGRPNGPRAFAVALIVIGFGFNVVLIPSRLYDALAGGTPSRYVTFNVMLLLGIYAAIVLRCDDSSKPRNTTLTLRGLVIMIVLLQITIGTFVGIADGASTRQTRTTSADVLVNILSAPDNLAEPYLFPPSSLYVKTYVPFLKKHHMNVFAEPNQAFVSLGIVPGGVATRQLPLPPQLVGWVHHDSEAHKAWWDLSTVYFACAGNFGVGAFPFTVSGSKSMVQWAVALNLSPATTYNPWSMPVCFVFLENYTVEYRAWNAVLQWISYPVLPMPASLQSYISRHPMEATAWSVLSGAYWNSSTLQKAFPRTHFAGLLRWAAITGSTTAGAEPALLPLHEEFANLVNRLG
jgi:hypothetical protein